jgi:hypothetical protein
LPPDEDCEPPLDPPPPEGVEGIEELRPPPPEEPPGIEGAPPPPEEPPPEGIDGMDEEEDCWLGQPPIRNAQIAPMAVA